MIVYHNKGPEGYRPFKPESYLFSEGLFGDRVTVVAKDGLYYICRVEKETPGLTISSYQEWVEGGWKQKHGTFEAAERFGGKLNEEAREAFDAFELLPKKQTVEDSTKEADDLKSELGDVLWCATALASNSTADIDAGIKDIAYKYMRGVVIRTDGLYALPVWRDGVKEICTYPFNLTPEMIDHLIDSGFEPLGSMSRNLHDDDDEDYSISEHMIIIMGEAGALNNRAQWQYNYNDDNYTSPVTYDEHAIFIREVCADLYLQVAYIAKQVLGVGLGDIMRKNMEKIDARISANRIDKSDGVRTADLL